MSRKRETTARSCPVCGKPATPDYSPFCSRGCKDLDLLRWLGEGYRIAGPPANESGPAGVDRDDDDS